MMLDRLVFGAYQFCAALPISHSTNYGQLFNYIRQRHPLDEADLRSSDYAIHGQLNDSHNHDDYAASEP